MGSVPSFLALDHPFEEAALERKTETRRDVIKHLVAGTAALRLLQSAAEVQLFLQADNGEIYLVRLTQQREYFYLDISDKGGVVLVIKRQP